MQEEDLKPDCVTCSPDGQCSNKFRELLKKDGGRLTNERKALLKFICDIEGHFKPENLTRLLGEEGYRVSLTTVYRNLILLVQAGIIRRTDVDDCGRAGGACYEHIWGQTHHDHLVCSRCGKRVEFSYPAIEVLQEAVAKEHGFMLERHSLELVGICPDCRKEASGAENEPGGGGPAHRETRRSDMTLLDLKEGKQAEITKLDGGRDFAARINSFGLFEGRRIRLVTAAPFKGPLLIEDVDSGARIMAARNLAEKIMVREVENDGPK